MELAPFLVSELPQQQAATPGALWLRGGFPNAYLATSDAVSMRWRLQFIATYLERDIPQLGPRIPSETLRRLWTMLAYELRDSGLARALLGLGSQRELLASGSGRKLGRLGDRKPDIGRAQ